MGFSFNALTGNFDLVGPPLTNPIQYIGAIATAADFPTLAVVQAGYFYQITANVTDNNPAKTNTGLSFLNGDEIVWNGTTWDALGNSMGTGDVVGPSSSVANNVAMFDSTSGKLLKDSGLTLSGSNTGDQDLSSYALLTDLINTNTILANQVFS